MSVKEIIVSETLLNPEKPSEGSVKSTHVVFDTPYADPSVVVRAFNRLGVPDENVTVSRDREKRRTVVSIRTK